MRFKAHAPRPIPARRKESALAAWWEATIAALCTAGAFAIIVAAAENPGSPPVNAAMPPLEAVEPPPSPFDDLPVTPEQIEASKAEARAKFAAAWAPKTLPRTSNAAGHVMALTDCDDRCQRQNARLDKQEAKAFDRLLSDKPHDRHDRRRGDRHDRHDRKGGHQ